MPKYSYMARNSAGAALSGELVAGTNADAVRMLRAEGKFVVKLQAVDEAAAAAQATLSQRGSRRVRQDEVIYFANQLAGMVDAGVPLSEALEATIDKSPPGAFRRTIEDVIQRVQGGSDLSAALAAHPRVFAPLFVHMVRASEATGTLGAMLVRVADYMTNQREIRKKIKGALMYPLFMVLFSLGATIFLMAYVLPKFTSIYAGKAAILPLPTRILMGASDALVNHWIGCVVATLVTVIGGWLFLRSPQGKLGADWLRLNSPVIGRMYRKACLTRALRTLGSMIAAGVSVLDAVLITRDVVGNRVFGRVLENAHRRLEQGDQLCQALDNSPFIPRPVWQMLHAGERTGNLGPAMDRISDLCETDLKQTIHTMTQFIEPLMIVVVGSLVGGIALAMLLPIFQVSRVMAQ